MTNPSREIAHRRIVKIVSGSIVILFDPEIKRSGCKVFSEYRIGIHLSRHFGEFNKQVGVKLNFKALSQIIAFGFKHCIFPKDVSNLDYLNVLPQRF